MTPPASIDAFIDCYRRVCFILEAKQTRLAEAALANALNTKPQSETDLAARFAGKGKWKSRLPELLATLATLGRARQLEDGRWMG